MRILVTGASGYIGEGVVNQLVNDGIEVIATDINESIFDDVEYVQTDLADVEHPYLFFGKPDICLHLAWKDGFKHNSDSHIENLPVHVRFIESLMNEGLKKIAIMGSVHEIGFYEGSISEQTPTNPVSKYGISKNALRQVIEAEAKQLNVEFQWIRGFYIVGNSTRGCSVFSKITEAEMRGDEWFPFTKGDNQFDFIDYNDFCYQIASIVEQNKINGIINACSGHPEKIGDRVERFLLDMNYKIKLQYGAFPSRPYDSKAIWGNDEKIKRILEERRLNYREISS